MKKIQMVDLYGQYKKIKDQVDLSIQNVIQNAAFIKGPDVKDFEQELAQYLNCQHVVGCANGTDALQVALMALDLQPGDEVVTPDFTFISTVEVGAVLGLKPVLVDVDPANFTLDPDALRKAITPKTKAIVPVHLYGQCANMDAILEIAKENNIVVIEDNAQAIGADYKLRNGEIRKAGTLGQIGCTSFFPSKNLGCYGDGGAICTDDEDLAQKMRAIANHGMQVKYHNDYVGINSRLDTLQAAILRVKLQKLDEYCQNRQAVADFYDRAFQDIPGLKIPARNPQSTHVFHQYTLLLDAGVEREKLTGYLEKLGIPTMVYYPVPMHRQKAYAYLGHSDSQFPVTNDLTKRVISLPIHTEMEEDQLSYIVKSVIDYLN
jgi:UDP-2-acetamido-2-deoxy-ribo-hexuluronate aminotransferase